MPMMRDTFLSSDYTTDTPPAATSAELNTDRRVFAATVELRQALCVAEAARRDAEEGLARERAWVEKLMAQNTELRKALEKWGMHEPGCKVIPGSCTCGLVEML